MDMYMLLYLKWITNKDLLYNTGNTAQCYEADCITQGILLSVMRQTQCYEGVWGRMDTCICLAEMAESLLYSPETIITLLIGYTK